jgi:uncharacterized protein (DUF2267 family)
MNRVQFVAALARQMGDAAPDAAERAAQAVLTAFGEALDPTEAQAIAGEMPEVAAAFLGRPARVPLGLQQVTDRVQYAERVRAGVAFEHVQLVCGTLADALSPSLRARLRRDLPEALAGLLEPTAPAPVHEPPAPSFVPADTHHAISGARPGSLHPVSEAKPERAHRASVARADNPHADSKLSSATGTTQERQRRTLASGEPGGHTPPVARSDEED